ncbi:hypothetical protein HYG87_10780 [Methanobacterium alkalithermotolerans]|uniref:Uncharacterized protein n=1 Tax=Methanobacterium alkalithermotolerans TaxID=2731220 RepID=A0A8T8K6G1_9EURY|nr:hypothetical protein [Methanobacterium alkalithermotolerans]QUH24206.1 hypothetical protein HYG87_10780 [Methanobacterium alkalithermotolerans]
MTKSLKLKKPEDEVILYRHGVFSHDEELVVFSLKDFLIFQEDVKKSLDHALEIVNDSRNNMSTHGPRVDAQRTLNWIKKTQENLQKIKKDDGQKRLI